MTPQDIEILKTLAQAHSNDPAHLLASHLPAQRSMPPQPVSAITAQPEPSFADKIRLLATLKKFAKLQGERFVEEPLHAMARIGGAMTGRCC